MNTQQRKDIYARVEANKAYLEERVGLGRSFDVVFREMVFGGRQTGLFYLNGFGKDEVMTMVLKRLTYARKEDLSKNALHSFFSGLIPHIQVELNDDLEEVINQVLTGQSALFIEGETTAILIDAKSFPNRSIEEPDLERVVRGSRDGFVETLLLNVTMVRRRVRDPNLMLEMNEVTRRTKTNVCIGYIKDIADPELVELVRRKLEKIKVDGIPMADKQLEEALVGKGWNPFPLVRYSERPDVVSSHMLEGHVVVFVDTSPSVMILPTTYFHLLQHAEEYRQAPIIGTYLRWVRYLGVFASLFLLPIWFLFVLQPGLKPEGLGFIGPDKTADIPILIQFLLVEVGVDLMRMAAVHTPTPLATAMGLIAAILIGDIAVQTGLFINEVILYMAIAAIGMFATPSYELGLANRIVRLILLILTAVFRVPGLVIGTTVILMILISQRSYSAPYMWPFIPFHPKALFKIIVRPPFLSDKRRPALTRPQDGTRQPE